MTESIDHRAMAERCMDRASRTEESDREASRYWLERAQVHATLALSSPASSDDPYWELAGQLEALIAAVRMGERDVVGAGEKVITMRRSVWDTIVLLTRERPS